MRKNPDFAIGIKGVDPAWERLPYPRKRLLLKPIEKHLSKELGLSPTQFADFAAEARRMVCEPQSTQNGSPIAMWAGSAVEDRAGVRRTRRGKDAAYGDNFARRDRWIIKDRPQAVDQLGSKIGQVRAVSRQPTLSHGLLDQMQARATMVRIGQPVEQFA